MNIVNPIKGGKIPLDYSMLNTGHPGITSKTIGTLQVVSFLVFLPENVSWVHFAHLYAPYDVTAMTMTHLVVGHTLRYTVSKFEANWTNGVEDTATFVSYPSPVFPILTIIST